MESSRSVGICGRQYLITDRVGKRGSSETIKYCVPRTVLLDRQEGK